jgi:hypothetical protein
MGGVGNNGSACTAGLSGVELVGAGEAILAAAFRCAEEAIAGAVVAAAGAELEGTRAAAGEASTPPRSGVIRFE